ncbi:MAG: OmpA family protein [Myxococcales bacterium]|nr:OmpA family protein [Myxococcales bacterium]
MSGPWLRSAYFVALAVAAGLTLARPAGAQGATPRTTPPPAGASAPGSDSPSPDAAQPPEVTAAPPGEAPATTETAPASAATPEEAAADAQEREQRAEWADRDAKLNESNTLTGGVGLLRTQHAQSGAPGQFRINFAAEWFSAGFLCSAQFPCPRGGTTLTSDTLDHVGATLSIGASLFKIGTGTFEGYTSIQAYANSDDANNPPLLQVLGDTNIGIKYVAPVGDVLHLGLFTELWLINGTGAVGLDGSGTSAKFGGLGTLDLRGLESHTPLRFSLNLVYMVDNTGDVVAPTEQARGQVAGSPLPQPVTRIERFGLGVNRVDHFDILSGLEFFAAEERVRPFLEAKILIPNNRQGYACKSMNPSGDHCMLNDPIIPTTLTLGSRFFPWKRGFSLLAALDIGISGTSDFVEELQPVPPWMLFLGAAWGVDTWERPPVIKTRVVEKAVEKAKAMGHLAGFVHEKDKNTPVASAILSYRDANLPPIATGADGKFGDDVPPGKYTLDVKAEGYKPGACEANVPEEGGEVQLDCPLEALPRTGSVSGHVRDADTNQPLGAVPVVLTDAQKKELRLATDTSGGFKFDSVTAGPVELSIVADGYLVLVVPTEVKARQDTPVELLLRPKPRQSNVAVTGTEITIKQQIQFALDSAVILPESFGLLTEIADSIIRHPEIRRVEVQGHTDNSGTPDHNMVLSEQRAEAVRAWLVQHGVPPDRLVSKGYGQDKPLVPNVTPQMRARNRRVQFIILEKEGAVPGAGPGAAPGAPTTTAPPPGATLPPGGAPAPNAPPPAPTERKKNPLPGF